MIVAGEASGDLHGANLVKALRHLSPDLEIVGIGGEKMKAAGVEILFDISQMAIVGFTEVLSQFKKLRRIFLKTCRVIKTEELAALILIDYPGFNLRLAAHVKKHKLEIPVIYYISPQVWAWGKGRVKRIAELVDKMIVVFPFEREIYRNEGLPVEFVGHPLLDVIGERESEEKTATDLNVSLDNPIVGLLPGSRRQEINRLLPLMLKAAKLMRKEMPTLRFILPRASTVSSPEIGNLLPPDLEVSVVTDKTYKVMALADLLLVASGTATLEAACVGTPMIIVYKVSLLNWLLAKSLIKIPHLGLVNVVAGRKVVPEFLQFEAEPRRLASAALSLLEDRDKQELMKKDLKAVKAQLGRPGASRRAAHLVLEMTEDRERKTAEDRRQRTEDREQKTEDRR